MVRLPSSYKCDKTNTFGERVDVSSCLRRCLLQSGSPVQPKRSNGDKMSQPNLAVRNNLRGFPRTERWLLRQVFKAIGPAPIRLAFKDGEEMSPPGVPPRATILIHDRPTLIGLMLDPEM